jgi:inner membrane protein
MDLVTQAVLGSTLAQSGSRSTETRLATGIGFAAGLLADADALIRSSSDTLLTIEYHRHFTHSIFFIPIGALIAAILLWPIVRKRIVFKRLYRFTLLGYCLSGFIDACTSYGTHLLWPLWDGRISFHLIAIVDPVFTLVLIIALVFAFKRRNKNYARAGLLLAGLYLCLGFIQLQRAETVIESLALERGHQIERMIVKPTFGNILLWRSIYEYEGHFYIDAVRVGIDDRLYSGKSIMKFVLERDGKNIPKGSVLYNDIQRFSTFSDGFIAWHPDHADVLGDVRYSVRPDGLTFLWGIELDLTDPGKHANFAVYRDLSKRARQRFYAMLLNEDI